MPYRQFNTKSVQVTVEELAGYVKVKLFGQYLYEDFCLVVDGFSDLAGKTGKQRIYLDLLDVKGDIPALERYNLGKRSAEAWGDILKVAAAAPAEKINRLWENTAVNRFARVRVFYDEASALDWLLQE